VTASLIQAEEVMTSANPVLFDCRFSLMNEKQGRRDYLAGHIPGAHHLDLNKDLSGEVGEHGGRHPLPDPQKFAATLARFGVDRDTEVVAYDDSRLAMATRLWWLMRSLGYRPPKILDGGYQAYLQAGGEVQIEVPPVQACAVPAIERFTGYCDIDGLRRAQAEGALVVDSREPARYEGLEEPIDPVAGHIPGAINRPWQGVTDGDGRALDLAAQERHWGDALESGTLVVYCGSGVSACVNLFSLALLGRDDATLYAGSWSDWCSYL